MTKMTAKAKQAAQQSEARIFKAALEKRIAVIGGSAALVHRYGAAAYPKAIVSVTDADGARVTHMVTPLSSVVASIQYAPVQTQEDLDALVASLVKRFEE